MPPGAGGPGDRQPAQQRLRRALARADAWIEIAGERAGDGVRLSVTDSGPPIPEEVRARIMEPFFTTKAAGEGTGLGLSISRGIAESQGGRLEFDAASPHTRFVLTLPAEGGAT